MLKRQEKQEANFRPNKWSLEAFYSNPAFSQHQLDQHTQEKHPAEMLTPY